MAHKQKRWMKSVVEASKSEMPALPWTRQARAIKAAAKPPMKRRAS